MKRSSLRPSLTKRVRRTWELYLFLLPAFVFYILFKFWPIYGLKMAFLDYSPFLGFDASPFVGLENFRRFFTSPHWRMVLGNTLRINLTSLCIGFPAPILLALLLQQVQCTPFKKTTQMITYAPYFISSVVLVGMMYTIFSPSSGVVNAIIRNLGGEPIFFMGRTDTFLAMFVGSEVWQNSGWNAVVYLAALAAVSPELHESALIDGANRLQRIRYIDLPSIMPTIITMFLLQVGRLFTVGFDKIYLMQNSLNQTVSEVLSTFSYKRGLLEGDFSYATAVGLMESGVNFILLLFFNITAKRTTGTSLW